MKNQIFVKALFYLAFIYDAVLGVAFILFHSRVFAMFEVTPPNHPGYVQFPGALLIVFAMLYLQVARDPVRSWILIPYGMLLKVSYCAIVFAYWFSSGIPGMWKPWAIIDLVFLVLFVVAFIQLRKGSE